MFEYFSQIMSTALVTGSSRGIGLEIAKMFSRNGYNVIITGTKMENALYAKSQVGLNNVFAHELNLCDSKSIQKFCFDIKKHDIEVVVHNAGMLSLQNWENINPKRLEDMVRVNMLGPMHLSQSILPVMKKKNKGHLLFFSPPYKIDQKVALIGPYMQTKLAQTTFMHSLAYSLKDTNIAVNSFWTQFPILTEAITYRGVGKSEDCMHPKIIADMVEKMVLHESPKTFKGNEILDASYLTNISRYAFSKNTKNLDDLFMHHLQSLPKN